MLNRLISLVAATVVGTATACTQWNLQDVSPEQGVAAARRAAVDLTLTNGERIVLHDPVLRDSIIEGTEPGARSVRRVHTGLIAEWWIQQDDRVGTMVAGGMAAVGLWAFYRGILDGF